MVLWSYGPLQNIAKHTQIYTQTGYPYEWIESGLGAYLINHCYAEYLIAFSKKSLRLNSWSSGLSEKSILKKNPPKNQEE